MTQARHGVHTEYGAPQPAAGRRPRMQRVEVLDPRDVILIRGTESMIRAFARLAASPQAIPPPPDPELVEAAGAAGSGNGDSGAGVADPLVTTEELAILTLMANGLTLESVAVRVSMSPRTLSRRLRCVCDRLGVTYPIQAIVWAARRGLI